MKRTPDRKSRRSARAGRPRRPLVASADAKDMLLAELELDRTRSQLQIERWQRLHAEVQKAFRRREAIYQNAPIGYITFDRKGLILEWNSIAAKLLEMRPHLLNAPFTFLAVPDHVPIFLDHLSRCKRASGGPIVSELLLRRRSGQVPVQIFSMPYQEGGDTVFLCALVDLSEREKGEERVEEEKNFSESIIQTIHEPLVVVDGQLKILRANEAFTRLFGLHRGLANGSPLESALGLWGSGNELRRRLAGAVAGGSPLSNFEFEVEQRNLGRRIFLFNTRQVVTKRPGPPALLVALEDITARKQAEESLADSNRRLHQLNEELEQRVTARTRELSESNKQLESFCYSIAHDLRGPLRAMTGFSTVLQDRFGQNLGEQGRAYIQKIIAGGEQMDALIHDLLEYGRFNTTEFERNAVDAEQVLTQVVAQMQPLIAERGAHIERKGRLPLVSGHKVALETVFSNLLTNALKFVPRDTTPEVTIWPEEQEAFTRIWIADNGIGIEPRHQQKIFEIFQRVHSRNEYPGTGIGLAIVQRALQRIGGDVGVESELGKGSRFWIRVARAPAS